MWLCGYVAMWLCGCYAAGSIKYDYYIIIHLEINYSAMKTTRQEKMSRNRHIHATNTEDTSIVCHLFEAQMLEEGSNAEYFLVKPIGGLLKDGGQLSTLLHNAASPAILIDYAISNPDLDTVYKAIQLAGKRGVLMIIFSGDPSNGESMVIQEQEVLGKLNLPSLWVRRVFLKLIPMGLLLSFMDAICSSNMYACL